MPTMKTLILALGSTSLLALAGCSSSSSGGGTPGKDASTDQGTSAETSTDTGSGSETGSGKDAGEGGSSNPTPPTLGTQIDRMGRPAINTALNHTFDPACTTTTCPAKDTYNSDNTPTHWATNVPQFEANLAIYDGLDTTCGNQAGFGALGNANYATLATVLAGDELWVNTAGTTCVQYLAVEFGALGITNTDCGGRTPNENTIDLTFNAVAGTLTPGTLPDNPGPVTNGIKAPSSPASSTFPYLSAPH
jgi:hypothetical protein